MFFTHYDHIIALCTRDTAVVRTAHRAFTSLIGEVRAEHELYAEHSDAFVEWMLLQWRDEGQATPIDRMLTGELCPIELSSEPARAALRALRSSHRSLFQLHALAEGTLHVEDLYGGGRFRVSERRSLPGVQLLDVFDARLIPDPDEPYRLILGRAVLFHPREAQTLLTQLAQKARQGQEPRAEFLARLLRLRLRAHTYRHVSPARIYQQDPSALLRQTPTHPTGPG